MVLGFLVFFTALTISAVAIYYSIAGLVAIFAAAALPIMIMGGALEIGKLVTAVWLHRYWGRAKWWLRTYLALSVVVLMFITSMGIFGFLSKAHIEQTSASIESVEQVERLETEIARQESIIVRAEEKIQKAESSTGNLNDDIQSQIDKEQERIDSAYQRIQPAIDEQNAIIQTQLSVLEDRVAVYDDEIKSLDNELTRLNSVVLDLRRELDGTSVASIEEQVQPYNEQIAQLDADLERINAQANEYEQRISNLEIDTSAIESLKTRIAAIEESIVVTTNKLQSTERAKIQEGQATIGVTSDGLFGSNTRRALQSWVEAQQERISQLQAQETDLRTQATQTLDNERTRLTELVKDLRGTQTDNINTRKQNLLDAIDSIRSSAIEDSKTAKQSIQNKIDTVLNTDIPANRSARQTAQEQITALRQADDPRINAARDSIKQLRESADAQIAASNDLIQRLRDRIRVDGGADVDAIIDEQTQRIRDANVLIDEMTEQKYAIEAEYRKLEAEVGPIKYIAEFIYEDADRDVLEEAVRWVIITIIFVFDPLAVLLLIASQYTFEFHRKPKPIDKQYWEDYDRARAERIVANTGFKVDNQSNDTQHDEHTRSGEDKEERSDVQSAENTGTSEANDINVDSGEDEGDNTQSRTGNDGGNSTEGLDEQIQDYTQDTEEVIQKKRTERLALLETDLSYQTSKQEWKRLHPDQTIKFWKDQYIKGKIDTLPWEQSYNQNEEQNENSIWQRIKDNE